MENILFIGGSDTIGGAGIQAHIKVATLNKNNALTILSCVSAQNTKSVLSIKNIDKALFEKQIEAILKSDVDFGVILISLLVDINQVNAICSNFHNKMIVLDPVFISKSGYKFLQDDIVYEIANKLFRIACVVTPNLYEFSYLLHKSPKDINIKNIEKNIYTFIKKYFVNSIVVKNIKYDDEFNVNVLYEKDLNKFSYFKFKKIKTKSLHGTGCTFAAFIATKIHNKPLHKVIEEATSFIEKILRNNISTSNTILSIF